MLSDMSGNEQLRESELTHIVFDHERAMVFVGHLATDGSLVLSPSTAYPPGMQRATTEADERDLLVLVGQDQSISSKEAGQLGIPDPRTRVKKLAERFPGLLRHIPRELSEKGVAEIERIDDYTVSQLLPDMLEQEFFQEAKRLLLVNYWSEKNNSKQLDEMVDPFALITCGSNKYLLPLYEVRQNANEDASAAIYPDIDALILVRTLKHWGSNKYGSNNIFQQLSKQELDALPYEELCWPTQRRSVRFHERCESVIKKFAELGVYYKRGNAVKQVLDMGMSEFHDEVKVDLHPSQAALSQEDIILLNGDETTRWSGVFPASNELALLKPEQLLELYRTVSKNTPIENHALGLGPQQTKQALGAIKLEFKKRYLSPPQTARFGRILKTHRKGGVRLSSGYIAGGDVNASVFR